MVAAFYRLPIGRQLAIHPNAAQDEAHLLALAEDLGHRKVGPRAVRAIQDCERAMRAGPHLEGHPVGLGLGDELAVPEAIQPGQDRRGRIGPRREVERELQAMGEVFADPCASPSVPAPLVDPFRLGRDQGVRQPPVLNGQAIQGDVEEIVVDVIDRAGERAVGAAADVQGQALSRPGEADPVTDAVRDGGGAGSLAAAINLGLQLPPAREAVVAGELKLDVGKLGPDARGPQSLEPALRLVLQVFEIGASRQIAGRGGA